MGLIVVDNDIGKMYSDICKDEDETVAPVPSSIVSQQRERNKTVTAPDITTSWEPATDYTMPSWTPFTSTFYGGGSVSLPVPAAATATDAASCTLPSRRILFLLCLATVFSLC